MSPAFLATSFTVLSVFNTPVVARALTYEGANLSRNALVLIETFAAKRPNLQRCARRVCHIGPECAHQEYC